MKISEYKTATGSSALELDKEVNRLIYEGFQPFGNPYLSDVEAKGKTDAFIMFQAMVMDTDTAAKILREKMEAKSRFAPKK